MVIDTEIPMELQKELNQIQVEFSNHRLGAMTDLNVNLKDTIINRQSEDAFLAEEVNRILERRQSTFELREKKSLWFQGRICVPNIPEIKEIILKEAHQTPYSIHPGSTNMYMDLKEIFWLSWYFDDSSHRDGLSKGLVGEQQWVRLKIGQ
jgi:hypothetical protein